MARRNYCSKGPSTAIWPILKGNQKGLVIVNLHQMRNQLLESSLYTDSGNDNDMSTSCQAANQTIKLL